ncbi:hypothetical protein ACLBOM_32770 [Escherichia coli]
MRQYRAVPEGGQKERRLRRRDLRYRSLNKRWRSNGKHGDSTLRGWVAIEITPRPHWQKFSIADANGRMTARSPDQSRYSPSLRRQTGADQQPAFVLYLEDRPTSGGRQRAPRQTRSAFSSVASGA